MAIIKQHDKRSGITYAYESISYWDKEKKQPRSRLENPSGKHRRPAKKPRSKSCNNNAKKQSRRN